MQVFMTRQLALTCEAREQDTSAI